MDNVLLRLRSGRKRRHFLISCPFCLIHAEQAGHILLAFPWWIGRTGAFAPVLFLPVDCSALYRLIFRQGPPSFFHWTGNTAIACLSDRGFFCVNARSLIPLIGNLRPFAVITR